MGSWSSTISRIIESIQISLPEIILESDKIREASIVRYNYPEKFPGFFRRNRLFPDRYVFLIKDTGVIKERGIIITRDKKILAESYGSIRRLIAWGDIRSYLFGKTQSSHIQKPSYFLRNSGFYHFMLEEIPALLYAIEKYDDLIILTGNKTYPESFYSSLELIFGSNYKQRIKKITGNTGLEKQVFTQRDPFSGGVHLKDISLLNKYFLPKINRKRKMSLIYISRKKSKKRKIANEDEMEKLLQESGFDILYMESHSLQEQIEMVHNAEVIIGPHGAGLTHLIWNPEKHKTVLEIFLSDGKNDVYASLSMTLGYNYNFMFCSKNAKGEICNLEILKSKVNDIKFEG